MWGATAYEFQARAEDALISIHAPRVGCDNFCIISTAFPDNFNPRTPCGVRHPDIICDFTNLPLFQSTHPVWGATTQQFGSMEST